MLCLLMSTVDNKIFTLIGSVVFIQASHYARLTTDKHDGYRHSLKLPSHFVHGAEAAGLN